MSGGSDARALLRHTVATLAYRGGKTLRDVPEGFADFRAGETTRSPLAILDHVGDLLDWARWMTEGEHRWAEVRSGSWEEASARFFAGLSALDEALATDAELGFPPEKIFQGPVADALTHVGQIAMLRRLAGAPVRGENYFKAEIEAGRVGPDQAAPRREFD